MESADLYIVAAGVGSRMNVRLPKALVTIGNQPCLNNTLRHIGDKFRKVFIVTNVLMQEQWQEYFRDLVLWYPELAKATVNLPIASGLGDGHAVLQGFLAAERSESMTLSNNVVIAWGDAFFPDGNLISELLSRTPKGAGQLPAVYENSPYVSLTVDEAMRCVSAKFSKHGEHHARGFHDQSVFRFDRSRLKISLLSLHQALWKGDRYISPGGEFSLLYSFHQLYNSGDAAYAYETAFRTLGFNTPQEVDAIREELSKGLEDQYPANPLQQAGLDFKERTLR